MATVTPLSVSSKRYWKQDKLMTEEIYDSARLRHPLVEEFRAIFKYQDLLLQFISRSLKTRYKRSVLGVVWTLLNPILTMIVLTLVFSNLFRFDIKHYPVYLLSGLVIWGFFSSTTTEAMGEMVLSGDLLRRIYVPKSVFAVSAIGTGLVNLGISLIPLFAIALITGVPIRPAILVMPPAILLLAIFSLGVGLILATAAVYFADMLPVYDVILKVWIYATPIFYPIGIIPQPWNRLFRLNPVYHLLRLFRDPLFEGTIPGWQTWAVATFVSLAALIVGGLIFTAKSKEYAYRV
jgi:ABC-type polysaccharide/polyol phosphate export permease